MLGVLLALASAVSYGGSDFFGGLASRKSNVIRVSLWAEAASVVAVSLALPWARTELPSIHALLWGAASGIGGVAGILALYTGFRRAAFSIAGPLSAVSAAGFSVVVGLILGERLTILSLIGIVIALPAIFLVSSTWRKEYAERRSAMVGVFCGLTAGVGFAVLFVALNRAGVASGLWPVVTGQVVALVILSVLAILTGEFGILRTSTGWMAGLTGLTGGGATVLYFFATHEGFLVIAAVLASLYPVVTVLLARLLLRERFTGSKMAGLSLAAVSVILLSLGGLI